MNNQRLDFLEQKVIVMQNEVSEVLGEMQSTIQAIAQTYSTALKVAMERIDALEKKLGVNTQELDMPAPMREGKDL